MSATVTEADRAAARSFVGGMAAEEAAKGLVESPEWNYDGATEVEKNYYRRFAVRCMARIEPLVAQLAADRRVAENRICEEIMGKVIADNGCDCCTDDGDNFEGPHENVACDEWGHEPCLACLMNRACNEIAARRAP